MTDKQKLKSLELKMQRIEKNYPEIDFKIVSKRFYEIRKYNQLREEHFHLKFVMEHCEKCGKKL
ncbi:MAG: hypothetical protein ACOVOQ_09385 [Flavobacterium sp.]